MKLTEMISTMLSTCFSTTVFFFCGALPGELAPPAVRSMCFSAPPLRVDHRGEFMTREKEFLNYLKNTWWVIQDRHMRWGAVNVAKLAVCLSVSLPSVELGCGLGVTLVLMLLLFVVYHVFWLELLLLYRSWFGTDERHSGKLQNPQSSVQCFSLF